MRLSNLLGRALQPEFRSDQLEMIPQHARGCGRTLQFPSPWAYGSPGSGALASHTCTVYRVIFTQLPPPGFSFVFAIVRMRLKY